MPHLVSIKQLSEGDIRALFRRVEQKQFLEQPLSSSRPAILGSLFFSASTRTRYGFESAMLRIGGQILPIDTLLPRAGPNTEESLSDIVNILTDMCDLLVVRLKAPCDINTCVKVANSVIINGGNGSGMNSEHPTQALSDMFFIDSRLGSLTKPKILLVGVMQHRVIRSLLYGFSIVGRSIVHVAYPDNCPPLREDLAELASNGLTLERVKNIKKGISEFDVVYHNGVPKDEYDQSPEKLRLDIDSVSCMKKEALIMHSMPRLIEYPEAIDEFPQALYFEQARLANTFKMQLLSDLLSGTI